MLIPGPRDPTEEEQGAEVGAEDDALLRADSVLFYLADDGAVVRLAGSQGLDMDAQRDDSLELYAGTACGMPPNARLRAHAIRLTSSGGFKNLILGVIMLNCLYMLFEPIDPQPGSAEARRSGAVEWLSMSIFSAELLLKVVARGLVCHEGAYLMDPWNWLDVMVVAPFWITLALPNVPSFASVQLARALRPLRTLRSFPVLRRTVVAFLKALPALSSVVMLTAFFYLVFGIVGVEIFSGSLHYRCVPTAAAAAAANSTLPAGTQLAGAAQLVSGVRPASDGALAAAGRALKGTRHDPLAEEIEYCSPAAEGGSCGAHAACVTFASNPPVPGIAGHFDSIRGAAAVLLQAMTFEEWTPLMYELSRAVPDMSTFTFAYFDIAALLGGFLFVNMFVAVIFDEVMRSVDFAQTMDLLEKAKTATPASSTASPPTPARSPAPAGYEGGGLDVTTRTDGREPLPALHLSGPLKEEDEQKQKEDRKSATGGEAGSDSGGDCCGFERPLRFLGYVTAFAIAANIAIMCAPYRGMSPAYEDGLQLAAYCFTAYFALECVLKLCLYGQGNPGVGWRQYWRLREDHLWNRLDFTVLSVDLATTALEQALALAAAQGGGAAGDFGNPTSVRILRVFRALRVLRAFKLSKLWAPLNRTLATMHKAAAPVASLALLILLFTLIFALLGKELFAGRGLDKLTQLHFDAPMPAMLTAMVLFSAESWAEFLDAATKVVDPSAATLFVVSALLIGNFVIVNLFVAVLVEAFVREERRERESREKQAALSPRQRAASLMVKQAFGKSDSPRPQPEAAALVPGSVTCFCCDHQNPVRRSCKRLLATSAWDSFVLLLVLISCVMLVYDTPALDPSSPLALNLKWTNYVLVALFALEAALKMCVSGVGGYLAERWNQLDLFVLLSSLLALALSDGTGGGSSVVRLLRVLRPLRLVRRVPGMASIFEFFSEVAMDVANVAGVVIFFLIVFAVTGLELYLSVDFDFHALSFDGFAQAMLLLFVSATGDDWPSYMYVAMSDPSGGKISGAIFFILWLYVGQWLLINLFVATVVNTFIRIKRAEQLGVSDAATPLMTREQRQWQIAMQAAREQEMINPQRPAPPPKGELRLWAYAIVTSRGFEYAMTGVILLNVGIMAMSEPARSNPSPSACISTSPILVS